MKTRLTAATFVLVVCTGMPMQTALAKAPPEQVAELDGPKYTCMGAERAGSAAGVAAYTGKYVGTWPGIRGKSGYEPGPYADEKPLFTITAQNVAQYQDKLNDGEKALLAKYPQAFRMNVYTSHRDFGYPSWVCDVTKKNAATSEVVHDGKGVTGIGGSIPFPFPQSGIEAVWNTVDPFRPWNEDAIVDIADVYAGGNIAWGKQHFFTLSLSNDPNKRGSYQDKINAYFYTGYMLPEREKGFTAVGYQPNDFDHDATQSWQYIPGIRRVREAPEVGFDYPVPPAGQRTVDDDYGFNGSPERYTWKLIGKKELYVPYANFKVNDTSIKYSDLIKPGTINPDYVRYELHRVWVIEGTLKQGMRHIYSRRLLYVDEDSWLTMWADNFDGRGQLWRVTLINYHYSQESSSWHRGLSVYHDLTASSYEATYLVNEEPGEKWWKLNRATITPSLFTPDAAARGGH
ncbi:MAG: DUF1329 domain-containing protein [Nevskia sp.]|nr:DUF1329 domain-containing protein [Nevskia sp.]